MIKCVISLRYGIPDRTVQSCMTRSDGVSHTKSYTLTGSRQGLLNVQSKVRDIRHSTKLHK